jgi:oxygen-independent coproporphyrinogen-3 oxidase
MSHEALIARYDRPVPRYTSYPTAPHFTTEVTPEIYGNWLEHIPGTAPISLYLHVPFCERLCLYCGCNTTVMRREAPLRAYAAALQAEIAMVAARIGRRAVSHVHWGGGTPSALPADCLVEIMSLIRSRFDLLKDAEIAIEIDPTALPTSHLPALRAMGITRASLGVQDLEPSVQHAIGRMQSYEQTEECALALRAIGVSSINLDLIYGLPLQTEESVRRTATRALDLSADRIAVFGYAHVPWMKRHQALIPAASLPGPAARHAQSRVIDTVLREAGYRAVGLDHYARPGDALCLAAEQQGLRRSFQGYTTDQAPALIGLGASAIGSLHQGYVQNAAHTPAYLKAINEGRFATTRGVTLSDDDRLRRDVIEQIMCNLDADLDELASGHGADPAPLLESAKALAQHEEDNLVRRSGNRWIVTEAGRPFVRGVASVFDAYLSRATTAKRHAAGV